MSIGKQMLQGWKEIADYVARDERTVRRWEKQRRLPVRRMPGNGRANVYVLVSELDQWLVHQPEPEPVTPQPATSVKSSRWFLPAVFVVVVLATTTTFIVLHTHRNSVIAAYSAGRNVSRIPGVEDLTLRGVYFYGKRTPVSLTHAQQMLEQALAKDPAYAPAWSALAITDLLSREYGAIPDTIAFPRARSEAQKAIALNSNSSDAHATLAFVLYFWDEQPAAAQQEFLTALQFDPNSALAHQWYGSVLTHEGRFTEALQQLDTAQRLEPNSTAILASRAYALGLSGHRDQAIDLLDAISEQDPNYSGAHFRIFMLSLAPPADIPRYLSEERRWATLMHDRDLLSENAAKERAYRSGGASGMWQFVLDWERTRHPDGDSAAIPSADAALGRNDDTIADLEKLATFHDHNLMALNASPLLLPLHGTPRFQALEASLGLPQLP